MKDVALVKGVDEMNAKYADQSDFTAPTDMKKMAYGGFDVAVEHGGS